MKSEMTWQPIETAPKDGSAVLVMRDIWPGTKTGRAEECNGHNTYVAEWWPGENKGKGAWVCYMDAVADPLCPVEPTHWMPLPPPPIQTEINDGLHDWQISDPGIYDILYECAKCKKRHMEAIDNPDSRLVLDGCTGWRAK